jgi:hypothetical protein
MQKIGKPSRPEQPSGLNNLAVPLEAGIFRSAIHYL